MMDYIYIAISWIMLRWHDLWHAILPGWAILATNWDWILAIVFLVITIRVILFPIFVKQIRSQRAMQALAPKVKELQEKYKGDQQTLRVEMMKLYQAEKVNPLMGCLPMFVQIPVFLGLFHVLNRLDPLQTKNTTLYGWTQAQWDSAVVARIFDAPIAAKFASTSTDLANMHASGITVKLVAGLLVMVMMMTTFMTSRQMILKTGWSQDQQQRLIQRLMLYGIPLSLLLSGWYFPIGVIVYWVTQNLFSLGQQYWVLHKYPPPVTTSMIPAKPGKPAQSSSSSAFQQNAVMRFLTVTPKPAGPSNGAASGFGARLSRLSARARTVVSRTGLSRVWPRGGEALPGDLTTPASDARTESTSRAPRPGARPVHPKSPLTAQSPPKPPPVTPTDVSGPRSSPATSRPGNGVVSPSRSSVGGSPIGSTVGGSPIGAVPGGGPNGSGAETADAAGSPSAGKAAQAPATRPANPGGGGGTAGGTAGGAAKASGKPAAKTAGKKAGSPQRKGQPKKAQPNRKGGSRR